MKLRVGFNVGDMVRVKTRDEMLEEGGRDAGGGTIFPNDGRGIGFVGSMSDYCGKEFKIVNKNANCYQLEGCGTWNFTEGMIELVAGKGEIVVESKWDFLETIRRNARWAL